MAGWLSGTETVRLMTDWWQNQEGESELLIMETSDPKERDYPHLV